ncbi:MAG: hypothetical protein JRI23_06560 [Deltaproteobacteria bacterium]|nr:hypothetical protein [Deltaproteobacteria bacterium]MBW2531250.1 hypothetical protein [Deltaproteobacteria bacterium]
MNQAASRTGRGSSLGIPALALAVSHGACEDDSSESTPTTPTGTGDTGGTATASGGKSTPPAQAELASSDDARLQRAFERP